MSDDYYVEGDFELAKAMYEFYPLFFLFEYFFKFFFLEIVKNQSIVANFIQQVIGLLLDCQMVQLR